MGLLFLIQCSCSKNNFPKYSSLDRLRILAITTPTPELQNPTAGITNVTISPYVSDITGTGDITLEIQSCFDPGVNLGAIPNCENGYLASSIQTVTMSSATTSVEGIFGSPERTGSPQSGAITVPLQIPPQALESFPPYLQYNGVSFIITVKVIANTGTINSFRRILISNKTPNNNPTIDDLYLNNNSFTQRPAAGTYQLNLSSSSNPENYQFLTGDGLYKSLTENYEVTWFVSEGLMEISRGSMSDALEWILPALNPSLTHKSVLVAVLRDSRGGTTIKIKSLNP